MSYNDNDGFAEILGLEGKSKDEKIKISLIIFVKYK